MSQLYVGKLFTRFIKDFTSVIMEPKNAQLFIPKTYYSDKFSLLV